MTERVTSGLSSDSVGIRIMDRHNDRRPFTPRRMHRLPAEAYCEAGSAFFLTSRCLPGLRPFVEPSHCRIALEALASQRTALGCWVGPYCLMPDHIHFIAGPGTAGHSVLTLLHRFHGASTNALWKAGWSGKVWQSGGYDVKIYNQREWDETGAYIMQNPQRAGLVELAEDWPWSGSLDDLEGCPLWGDDETPC